ncbi:MAG: VIT1/CCC1 family protein [bacterium]|nr:VIT1/CCC1 family protein [bacterium]
MDIEDFAYREYKECVIYSALLKYEKNPEFKRVLESIIQHETSHYNFWNSYAKKEFKISPIQVFLFKVIRKILGLTFTLKLIEGSEKAAIKRYSEYLKVASDPVIIEKVKELIKDEQDDERKVIESIKEQRVEFLSNIILGLNDALIELTGALVGFSFAFNNTKFIALAGCITGIAASLSMGASAYMQASYERSNKSPVKAGFYTLFAYLLVVCILVMPFLLISNILTAVIVMFLAGVFIVGFTSFYTSVLFSRSIFRHFLKMFIMSIGVAFITFIIGRFLRSAFNIDL